MSEQQELKQEQIDQLSINALRFLAVDMVQNANSGHPGMPLDAAAFRAVAAPFSRVLDQLRIESAFTSNLIAFTAPDYMFSQSDPDARTLLTAYLQYMGRS